MSITFKIKIKLALIMFAIVTFASALHYLNSNYNFFIKKDKTDNVIKVIEEEICNQKIFREVQKVKDIKDLNEESKYVYRIIIEAQDILKKLGAEKDQSEDFYNLFRDLGKVNIFFDIKNKFNFLYQTSYKLPIAKDLEQLLEKRVLYKTYSLGHLFFLQITALDDQKLKQTLAFIRQGKFTEAYSIYQTIDFEQYNLTPTGDKSSHDQGQTGEDEPAVSLILRQIGQDLFVLSSIESMYLDIFQVLRNSH